MAVETERGWTAGVEIPEGVDPALTKSWKLVNTVRADALSNLTVRILLLNFSVLALLLLGMVYLDHSRAALVEAKVDSFLTQGEVIATAVAASKASGVPIDELDAERLKTYLAPPTTGAGESNPDFEFSIDPVQIAPLVQRVVSPSRARARIYDSEGRIILDSRSLHPRGRVEDDSYALGDSGFSPWWRLIWNQGKLLQARIWFRSDRLPFPSQSTQKKPDDRDDPEIASALSGLSSNVMRVNEEGQLILSVAVPVERRFGVAPMTSEPRFGVVAMASEPGVIDGLLYSDGLFMMRLTFIACCITACLAVLFAGAVTQPVRQLAEAAERVRRASIDRQEIPDLTSRNDAIGDLSGTLRDMTQTLYQRMDAIEKFAADVSHEFKNPLTSLRSAVESLPLSRNDAARDHLLSIMKNDVIRLNRLISDISNASRLDAELARRKTEPVDVAGLLRFLLEDSVVDDLKPGEPKVILRIQASENPLAYMIMGDGGRLIQVISNLVDNAKSFSPKGGTVRVLVQPVGGQIEIQVEDDGPGIPSGNFDQIFERFYTDRPQEDEYGKNSGLGLSISKQIVEAHKGRIWAENRLPPPDLKTAAPLGARFVVLLPRLILINHE